MCWAYANSGSDFLLWNSEGWNINGKKGRTSTIPMLGDVMNKCFTTQETIEADLLFMTKDYSRFRCGPAFIHVQIAVNPVKSFQDNYERNPCLPQMQDVVTMREVG